MARSATGLLVMLALAGCGVFGGKDDGELKPAELQKFDETLEVRRLWSEGVGGGSEFLRLALMPAGDGSRVFAASHDGNVVALDARTGKRAWRVETEVLLSAGPGVGEGHVIVGGLDGDLICLTADTGREVWRRKIDGEVLAPPVIRNDSVVVTTIDGKLRVLSRFDGSERWSFEQTAPALTLRGSAAPVVVGTTVVSGFDNGRLIAANLLDGAMEWEAVLSPPSGRSDLERLSDVDGMITAVGQDIYATGYHGRLAALAAESGQMLWAREVSTHTGVSADWNYLYTTNETGAVLALSRNTGAEIWRNDALLRREPTVPVPFDTAVAVGDFEGYVHFFSTLNGTLVARERVGKGMISGTPVVIGGILYVQSEAGVVAAFAVPRREAEPAADGDN